MTYRHLTPFQALISGRKLADALIKTDNLLLSGQYLPQPSEVLYPDIEASTLYGKTQSESGKINLVIITISL